MTAKRVVILMLDSLGIGGAPDAADFGDEGANTLGAILKAHPQTKLPNLSSLGLLKTLKESSGADFTFMPAADLKISSKYGYMLEAGKGKDTSSGHWEMAGVPVNFKWGYFKPDYPSFPAELIEDICCGGGIDGILGDKAASGTEIIDEFGEEHIKSLKPIIYTSADSVFQIAAHEKYFGLERLYKLCEIAFKYVAPYNIARVIARPFEGECKGGFKRTGNRHDYSVKPPKPTVLDKIKDVGGNVIAVGKISDIFAGQGISKTIKANGTQELWDATLREFGAAGNFSLVFTNFVDFDMVWGHRRDTEGYAKELEFFDNYLPKLIDLLSPDDIIFITADHGCDPSFKGSDHTRENVPVIMFGCGVKPQNIGRRRTFADIGQTIASYFGLDKLDAGEGFL